MQILYSMNRDQKITQDSSIKRYRQAVDKSFDLYLYALLHLYKICGLSLREYNRRKEKYIQSEADLSFTPTLWENEIVKTLHNNLGLQKRWKQSGMLGQVDLDYLKKIYKEFSKTEEYEAYRKKENPSVEDHRSVLQVLNKTCFKDEGFLDLMEAFNSLWVVDESLVLGAMKRTLKILPTNDDNFFNAFLPEDEPVNEFGEELLKMVIREEDALLEIIQPALQNWDITRVAIIDLILLKMAVSELMKFPTIPTKVTLNEYVEISKQYSTEKSKDFINGILDRLMKQLEKEGKITKEGRGLVG